MSVIFNHTFTADKPIYYPSNWQSGKTAEQLYQQFKQGLFFIITKNTAQIIISSAWIFLVYTIIMGVLEIIRIRKLPDSNMEKARNRKYINNQFLIKIGFIGMIVLCATLFLCFFSIDSRFALLKGLIGFIVIFICKKYRDKYVKRKQTKNGYTKLTHKQQ